MREPGSRKGIENKVSVNYSSIDCFNYYRKRYPEYKLTERQYAGILKEIMRGLAERMFKENLVVPLPSRMGEVFIEQKKRKLWFRKDGSLCTKALAINYKKSKELWEKEPDKIGTMIRYSDRNRYWIKWSKITSNVTNIKKYIFKPTRINMSFLREVIDQGKVPDYLESL